MNTTDKLLNLIRDKVMCLVNLKEEDLYNWDNETKTNKVVHKYFVYDCEEYEREEITKEEFEMLKSLKEGK